MKKGDTIYVSSANVSAFMVEDVVIMRDTSLGFNTTDDQLVFTVDEWKNLIHAIKNGAFDIEEE